jgi:hypothetical protein
VRCCGHLTVAAQDISRQFLLHLLREFQLHGAPSSRKHYRNYLLERLQAFLAGDRSDPTTVEEEARLIAPADLEPRYQHDRLSEGSPEEAFQRSFALEVLSRAFRRLRTEAKQTDHLDMFVALEPYLAHDPDPGEYEVLAARLRRRPLILALALKRLRERLRELTGEELADTVSTAEDLAGEQATLLEILRDRPS